MAFTRTYTTINNTGGLNIRRTSAASRKRLISLDVLTNDTSVYSPYYFNVVRKPLELKLGGNIFEFAPPRNRFKLKSEIIFEAVDSQNIPLAYEILPKQAGSSNIRMCIFIYDTNVDGAAIISLVGESLLDDCGCPVPREWEDTPNVRWTTQAAIRTDDVSDTIEYDTAPVVSLSETKIPWTYQTYEDVYNINPGSPGSPYTVSGSYSPTYNSQQTNSGSNANDGVFTYIRAIEPDTSSIGLGVVQVTSGNLRFSASMVGGILYVSGGNSHINNAKPSHGTMVFPAYYATVSAVISDTQAQVVPAYGAFQYEMGTFYPTQFDASQGARLTWTETSSSTAYTDPTADTTTMQTVASTIEAHTSYIDLEINNLKPVCGVATDIDVFIKSTRIQGPLIKLTEFPIEPSIINIDDSQTTEAGNTEEFKETGVFTSLSSITNNWEEGGSLNSVYTQTNYNTSVLMGSAQVFTTLTTQYEHPTQYITFQQKGSTMETFRSNTSYFIEFDAIGDKLVDSNADPKLLAEIDVYISGSGIAPTDYTAESSLGQHIGTIKNAGVFQQYIGNSFEYRNETETSGKLIFVLRQGMWYIRDIKIKTCPDTPDVTGITPHTTRALIPMPALTKYNDEYEFLLRYKNKNTTANKVSTFGPIQMEGNDPNNFLASQPGANTLSPWFHGLSALTSSKHVHISGNLYVSQSIFGSEFHTRVVTSSILFQEGNTIFGNTVDDTHEFVGNITASSINGIGGHISASGALFGGLTNIETDNTVFYNPITGLLTYGEGGGVGFPYSGSDHQYPLTGTPRQAIITGSLYVSSSAGGGHITASGNVSASGLLFISASHVTRQSNQLHQGVLVYDSGSGQVYMTGSYGGNAASKEIDTNTTYGISVAAGDAADEEKIRLTAGGDGSGTDDVVLEAGTGLSIAASGDKITFTNSNPTDTNTVDMGDGFKIRDDDNDDVTLTENKYIKFVSATGTAGTNLAGTGTTLDPYVMTITSPNTEGSNTFRPVTAGGNTLGANDSLDFVAAGGMTITETGGDVTLTSANDNDNTHRTVTAGGNTLTSGETLAFTAGTNLTITENAGAVTINATAQTEEDYTTLDHNKLGGIAPGATNTTQRPDWTQASVGTIHATNYSAGGGDVDTVNAGVGISVDSTTGDVTVTNTKPSDVNFTSGDHTKLDGIDTGATLNTRPAISGSSGPDIRKSIHTVLAAPEGATPVAGGCFAVAGIVRFTIDYTCSYGDNGDPSVPNTYLKIGTLMGYIDINNVVNYSNTVHSSTTNVGANLVVTLITPVVSNSLCITINKVRDLGLNAGVAGYVKASFRGL